MNQFHTSNRLRFIAAIIVLALFTAVLPLALPQPARAAGIDAFTVLDDGGFGGWTSFVATPMNSDFRWYEDRYISADTGDDWWTASATPPTGQRFVPGTVYPTKRFADAANAGLDVSGNGSGCNQTVGTLTVLEAVYSARGALTSFAADYAQSCGTIPASSATLGSMRINSSVGFTALSAPSKVQLPFAEAGTTGPAATVVIDNPGTAPVEVGAVQMSDPKAFTVIGNACSGRSIPVGGSCQLIVAATPAAAGWTFGQITVQAPGQVNGQFQIRVESQAVLGPVNDFIGRAVAFAPQDLPYARTQTSDQATADTERVGDPAPLCGAAPGKTVWYKATVGAEPITVIAKAIADSPAGKAPGVSIYQAGDELAPIGCGGKPVELAAKTTYFFVLSGDVGPGSWTFQVDELRGDEVRPADFVGVNPIRMLDTRAAGSTGPVRGGTVRALTIAGQQSVPGDAGTVSMNVTVTGGSQPGYVTVYPCGSQRPVASNLNYIAGQTIPNAVLSKVGSKGQVCFYASGTTHLIVDVNGYFPTGSEVSSITPNRAADTRSGTGVRAGVLPAGTALAVPVAGRFGVAKDASAVSLNVTVTGPATDGFVTAYPCGQPRPTASNLNFVAGQTIPNAVISAVGSNGSVCFWSSANTHLVVDVNGAFAADANYRSYAPERVRDTRSNPGSPVPAGKVLRVQLAEPHALAAASMNVTVTQPDGAGYVTVYPCDEPRPNASNLNFVKGQTIPNAVVTPVSADGAVCFYTSSRAHLIVDINGVFPG